MLINSIINNGHYASNHMNLSTDTKHLPQTIMIKVQDSGNRLILTLIPNTLSTCHEYIANNSVNNILKY